MSPSYSKGINQGFTILYFKRKKNNEDILVEKTIDKWLNIQKTIKEELTLEDAIIKQKLENLIIIFCAILSNIK